VLSALSALRQTRPADEVLVLCDGCSDGTAEAVRALGDERVTAIELPKASGYAYGHRNRALELARSSVVTWLADDDLLLPDHLERVGEYWDTGMFGIVTTPAAIVHPDDSMEWIGQDWSVPWNRREMQHRNTNVMASVSVAVDLARDVGGWDAALARAADWDLWKRVLATGTSAAMTAEATVLHFRATGRDQAWPLRVRQNTDWLEKISDPARLPGARRTLRRLNAEHDSKLRQELAERDALLRQIHESSWWRLREDALRLGSRSRRLWRELRAALPHPGR